MPGILCAVDASELAPKVVARAVEAARSAGQKVTLLRAVSPLGEVPVPELGNTLGQLTDAMVAQSHIHLADLMKTIPGEFHGESLVVLAQPWRAIVEHAKSMDASLVVMGAHSYSILDRALGTTSSKVINHLDRDVLVVRR